MAYMEAVHRVAASEEALGGSSHQYFKGQGQGQGAPLARVLCVSLPCPRSSSLVPRYPVLVQASPVNARADPGRRRACRTGTQCWCRHPPVNARPEPGRRRACRTPAGQHLGSDREPFRPRLRVSRAENPGAGF